MAIGVYGTIRPADVRTEDIDVFYSYTPNRNTVGTEFIRVNSSDVLAQINLPEDEQILGYENILEGMYDLTLPATIFNNLGIYTIYIKPKTITTTIIDCNVLTSLPSVRGIVIDTNDPNIPTEFATNNSLQGYRIEYIDVNGNKIRNTVRYVVTSNKVVKDGNTYRFDDNSSQIFLQLTPSSSSDVKPNVKPFMGNPGQTILISNTFFTPLMLEVEMVENTIDTLTNIVAGEQIKDVRTGKLTHYDEDRNIVKQFNLYTLKDETTNVPLYEVKEKSDNIDTTQNFDDIVNDVI